MAFTTVGCNMIAKTPEAIQKVNDSVKSEIQRMIDSYHNNCIEETLWK